MVVAKAEPAKAEVAKTYVFRSSLVTEEVLKSYEELGWFLAGQARVPRGETCQSHKRMRLLFLRISLSMAFRCHLSGF